METNRWDNNPLEFIDERPPFTRGSKKSLVQLKEAMGNSNSIKDSNLEIKSYEGVNEASIPEEWSNKIKSYIEKTGEGAEILIKYDKGRPISRIEYTFLGETIKLPFRLTGEHLRKAYSKLQEAVNPYFLHSVRDSRCKKIVGPDKR